MRPETALAVKKIIEEHFNNICASFNVPADQEAYHNQLLDHIRESFPQRDPEFCFTIFQDFWEHIIAAAKSLDQNERWGKNPFGEMAATAKMRPGLAAEAPEAAALDSSSRPPKSAGKNLLESRVVLDQIAALGDCLTAIAGDKELQSRKQTFISLGVLIHQIVEIVNDLLDKKEI